MSKEISLTRLFLFANESNFTYNYLMKIKEAIEKPQWDKGKIVLFFITLLILVAIGFEARSIILGDKANIPEQPAKNLSSVKGASTEQFQAPDIRQNVQSEISNLKNEAANINLVDVASSSPQVQKVINDLKALQNYPQDKLKETCTKICNGL